MKGRFPYYPRFTNKENQARRQSGTRPGVHSSKRRGQSDNADRQGLAFGSEPPTHSAASEVMGGPELPTPHSLFLQALEGDT